MVLTRGPVTDFGYNSDKPVIAPTNSVMHTKAVKGKEEDTEKLRSRGPRKYHDLHNPLNTDSRKVSHVGVSQNPAGEI